MEGWKGGRESGVKDCLQQSKTPSGQPIPGFFHGRKHNLPDLTEPWWQRLLPGNQCQFGLSFSRL